MRLLLRCCRKEVGESVMSLLWAFPPHFPHKTLSVGSYEPYAAQQHRQTPSVFILLWRQPYQSWVVTCSFYFSFLPSSHFLLYHPSSPNTEKKGNVRRALVSFPPELLYKLDFVKHETRESHWSPQPLTSLIFVFYTRKFRNSLGICGRFIDQLREIERWRTLSV